MSQFSRNTRSISEQTGSKFHGSDNPLIKIQQPVIKDNMSQLSSSIRDHNKSQLSIHDKISMLNQSIKTSEKNQKLFHQNMMLKDKLHQTEEALQDANIKCSLWDKFKSTIQGLNKDYLHLKSIQNQCSDGTVLKQFISVLKDKLEKVSISQRVEKSYSVQSKRKDTEYYQLYEQQKKQRYEYEQHIITLNNELDILEQENQKLKEKLKVSSLSSSGIIISDGKTITFDEKQLIQQVMTYKQQNTYILEHNKTLVQQLEQERQRVKQIEDSLDKYEQELKERQVQLRKKIKDLQSELQMQKEIQKTFKIELEEQIEENNSLRLQVEKLTTMTNSYKNQHPYKRPEGASETTEVDNHNVLNMYDSKQYIDLTNKNDNLYQKYKKIKAENQVLGEEKQIMGQQMQELEQLSKEMEYNYEVKIDDLRRQYEGQIKGLVQDSNTKISALNAPKLNNTSNQIETQDIQIQLLRRYEKLQREFLEQQQKKQSLINGYENYLLNCRSQITQLNSQLEIRQQTIIRFQKQVALLVEQNEQTDVKSNKNFQIQSEYQTRITKLEIQAHDFREKLSQGSQQICQLKGHIQNLTTQLNDQDALIQQYKSQLKKKDQIIISYANQSGQKSGQFDIEVKKQWMEEMQGLRKTNQQLRRSIHQSQQNAETLKQSIFEYQSKYSHFQIQNRRLQLQIEQLNRQNIVLSSQNQNFRQQNKNLTQQLPAYRSNMQSLKPQNQNLKSINNSKQMQSNSQTNTFNIEENNMNMDGLMAQSLKQQIDTLLQENRQLEQENNRYHQEFNESQLQVQEIQRYVKMISVENKKIPHYENEINKQRLKSQRMKQKLLEQRDKFMAVMQKNQALHQNLIKKSERNETILKQNIRIQKQETQKLQNIIKRYYFNHSLVYNQERKPTPCQQKMVQKVSSD